MGSYRKKRTIITPEDKRKEQQRELASIKTLMKDGKLSKAISELMRYIEEHPMDPYGHYLYGKVLLRNNDLEGAIVSFEKVASSEGKNKHSGLVYLGRIYELEGNVELARFYYNEAIKCNPFRELRVYSSLASLEKEDGNLYLALNILSSGIELAAGGYGGHSCTKNDLELELAKHLTSLGRHDEAEKILDAIKPENMEQVRDVAMKKGIIHRIREEYQQAILSLEKVRNTEEKDRKYYFATMELARIHKILGNIDEEIACLEDLANQDIYFNGNVQSMLGIARTIKKDYKGAKEIFRKGLTANEFESRNICAYYYSVYQILEGDEIGAERTLKSAIASNNSIDRLNHTKLIRLLYDQGKFEEAEYYLAQVRTLDSKLWEEDFTFRRLEILINKKQGKPLAKAKGVPYIERQFIDFNREESIRHTEEHHIDNPNNSSFPSGTDIRQLYEDAQIFLTEDNMLTVGLLDEYEIIYPNAGYSGNKILDTIRVGTIPGTKDIVTIYPSEKSLTPTKGELKKELEKTKTKGNAQVNKFNARFAKFTSQQ